MTGEMYMLPFFLPLAGALLLLFSRLVSEHSTVRPALRATALVTTYGMSAFFSIGNILSESAGGFIGAYHPGIAIRYEVTPLLSSVYLLAVLLSFISELYAKKEMRAKPDIAAVIHIQLAFIGFTLISRDLFNLFVTLEVLGITSYILIASGEKYRASLASISYLLMSSLAMAFFLLGIFGIYRQTGSLDLIAIRAYYLSNPATYATTLSVTSIAVALLMRTAIFPVHTWLPEAHASAPHHVSALLSGLLIKIPLFPLALIVTLTQKSVLLASVLLYGGAVSAILAVVSAFSQKDMKRLLAFHSVSQMGYVVASFGAFLIQGDTELLYIASLLHLTFHALFKATLFLTVGRVIDLTGSKDVYRVRNGARILLDASRSNILVIIAFFLSALSIAATPATNAFISKQLITDALKDYPLVSWTLVATGAFTVASFIKLSRVFFGDTSVPLPSIKPERKGIDAMILSILFLLASSIAEHFSLSLPLLSSFHPYDASHLTKTFITIAAGGGLYALVRFKRVREFMHVVEGMSASLTMMLLSIPLFIAALAILLHTASSLL